MISIHLKKKSNSTTICRKCLEMFFEQRRKDAKMCTEYIWKCLRIYVKVSSSLLKVFPKCPEVSKLPNWNWKYTHIKQKWMKYKYLWIYTIKISLAVIFVKNQNVSFKSKRPTSLRFPSLDFFFWTVGFTCSKFGKLLQKNSIPSQPYQCSARLFSHNNYLFLAVFWSFQLTSDTHV